MVEYVKTTEGVGTFHTVVFPEGEDNQVVFVSHKYRNATQRVLELKIRGYLFIREATVEEMAEYLLYNNVRVLDTVKSRG